MTDPRPHAWNSTLRVPRKRMDRGERIERRAEMPKSNAKRAEKRKAEGLVYGPYHQWIKTLPCTLASDPRHECKGKVEGHHLHRVGNGGVDAENEIPLCEGGHTLSMLSVHVMGPDSFDRYWGIDSKAIAAALWARYGGGEG